MLVKQYRQKELLKLHLNSYAIVHVFLFPKEVIDNPQEESQQEAAFMSLQKYQK